VRAEVRATRTGIAFIALLGAFGAWTAASLLWTDSVPRTVAEVERDLVYVATVAALLVLPRSRRAIAAGTVTAICGVCAAALATRLFPERYGLDTDTAFRLARPLGYWNGLGLLAAMGALLAFGVVVDARRRAPRSAAAAALVLLLATLFATLSRGAWLALAGGSCVALALHPARGRFAVASVVAALPAAAGVALFASANQLTAEPSSLAAAASEGRRLAFALAALALVAAAAPFASDAIVPRLSRLRRPPRRVVAGVASAAALLTLVAAAAFAGRAYDAFRTPQRFGEHGAGARLFSVSGQNRSEYWRVALEDYVDHPLLGSGAGTYDLYWTRDRPTGVGARDAHSLYLEALAELGPVGLALLATALAAPFFALRGRRGRPYVAALAGAYAAFLAHAAADWDWELPTVTLAALACATGLACSGGRELVLPARARRAIAVAAAATAVAAISVQRGNDAVAASEAALFAGRHEQAVASAARGARWAPWTAQAWRLRSDAERALGDLRAARRSSRRAVRRDPRDWTGWYQLARLASGPERADAAARVRALNPLAPTLDSRSGSR
jgi:O-antigen ligase